MIRTAACAAVLLAALAALPAGAGPPGDGPLKPGTLVVGTYKGFAPVCSEEGGVAKGRDVEFLRRFAAERGLAVEFRFFEFEGIWARPGAGECDVAAAGIAPLPARAADGVEWSALYFGVKRSLLIRKADAKSLRTMADFAGRTVAVTKGSTADVDTVARKPASAKVAYYDDQAKAVADLLAGRIDAFGEGDVSNEYLAGKRPAELALADIHPMVPAETFALAVRKKSEITAALNAFIAANKAKY